MKDKSFKISYSRINTYLFCPQKYKLIYIDGKYIPVNADISFGLSIHRVMEHFYNSGDYTAESMQKNLNACWDSSGFGSPQEVYVYFLRAKKLIEDYWNKYGQHKPKSVMTEKHFETSIGKYKFIGIIDRIDENNDGTFELIDYKTHKNMWEKEKIDNDLQLSLYCYACKNVFDFLPDRIAVYFLSHNEKIYTSRNNEQIQQAADLCLAVSEKINLNYFDPDVSKCALCDFKNSCEFSAVKNTEK